MANVNIEEYLNYNNASFGTYDSNTGEGISNVIGCYGTSNGIEIRAIRFKFTTPAEGASSISITGKIQFTAGTRSSVPSWYITTNSEYHSKADSDNGVESFGQLTVTKREDYNWDYVKGSKNIVLMPNTTYYLYIFPYDRNVTAYWYHYPPKNAYNDGYTDYNSYWTITLGGGAGLVYIYNGNSFDAYQTYIYNGTSWELYMPYIYNGIGWDLHT